MKMRQISQGLPITTQRVKPDRHVPRSWRHVVLSRTVLGPFCNSMLQQIACPVEPEPPSTMTSAPRRFP